MTHEGEGFYTRGHAGVMATWHRKRCLGWPSEESSGSAQEPCLRNTGFPGQGPAGQRCQGVSAVLIEWELASVLVAGGLVDLYLQPLEHF